MNKKFGKFLTITVSIITISALALVGLALFTYLKVIPSAISNPKVISYIEKTIKEKTKFDTEIVNPAIKTSLKPEIEVSLADLKIKGGKNTAFNMQNFETKISFEEIFKKKIIIEKINLDYIFADINKIMAMLPQQTQEQSNSDWSVDLFRSTMNVKNAQILYKPDKATDLKLSAKNLKISDKFDKKYINYDITTDITKNKNLIKIKTTDNNKVYIKNMEKLFIDNGEIAVNKSNIIYNGTLDTKSNFDFNFKSKNFSITETLAFLDTQIVENNINEQLSYFKEIKGNYDFDINITNKDMNGKIDLKGLTFKLIPFADLPVALHSGKIILDSDNIKLDAFNGYYNNKPANKISFSGTVKDYMKSVDTNIEGDSVITDDFSRNFLSKMIGYPIGIEGLADTRIKLKSTYNKIDLVWLCRFKKGNGFIIDGEESFMNDAANRVMAAKMHFKDTLLNIESINYYAGNPEDDKKEVRIPILSMDGNIDFANGETFIKDFGFSLPKPMPSGFLNAILKQKLFKGGTFTGNMRYINTAKYPYLEGDMKAEKVGIPSQRMYLKHGEFSAQNGFINISSDGRFRRSAYTVNSSIVNELRFPIIVKDALFELDKIDVEKYLQFFNNQKPSEEASADIQSTLAATTSVSGDIDDDDNAQTFDLANLIIEKCILKANSGFYKDIKFSDVKANLTLDKENQLKITSNRFNIAEGISSAKINCDLKNHLYNIKLGIKDVNSDIIATSLLNLSKEIDGKASGLIDLYTDDSLKLNGKMKFKVNNGVIGKIGLVEYLMKVASLFRNPLTMISPTTISDLVNIPEGRFNLIEGDLKIKDNIVIPMIIKSSAPQLSSYIIGTYNLENQDAALRIYTKFSSRKKGVYGFFRNFSLNALANRIPLSSRNDSNYYESEISQLPPIEADEKDCQIFLTKVDGDIEHNNFISSLKKIK